MENGKTQGDLMRLTGVMAVFVGIAWAIQILGLSQDPGVVGRLLWTLAAASVSGAGVGLVVTAGRMPERQMANV